MKIKEFRLLFFSFGLLGLSFIYAFLSQRPLLGEGSTWYLKIISHHNFYYDEQFTRYLDLVLQAPALLLLQFGQYSKLAIYLLSFCYTMHPLVSLLSCYLILKRKKRLELIIFPIFSLISATLPTLALATGMAADTLSLFWPLFFLILLLDSKNNSEKNIIALLLLGLFFSYEPAIIFYLIIISLMYFKIKSNAQEDSFNRTTIWFSVLGIVYFVFNILKTAPRTLAQHTYWMYSSFDTYRMFGFLSLVLFLFLFFNKSKFFNLIWNILFIGVSGWIFYQYLDFNIKTNQFVGISPTGAFPARTTAIPMACLLAIGAYLFHNYEKTPDWFTTQIGKKVVRFLALIVFVGALCDFKTTYFWNEGYKNVEQFVLNHKGCVNIDINFFESKILPSSIPNFSIAALSVMAQILNNQKEIDTLVFADEYPPNSTGRNACQFYDNGTYISNESSKVVTNPSYLNYSTELKPVKNK